MFLSFDEDSAKQSPIWIRRIDALKAVYEKHQKRFQSIMHSLQTRRTIYESYERNTLSFSFASVNRICVMTIVPSKNGVGSEAWFPKASKSIQSSSNFAI